MHDTLFSTVVFEEEKTKKYEKKTVYFVKKPV